MFHRRAQVKDVFGGLLGSTMANHSTTSWQRLHVSAMDRMGKVLMVPSACCDLSAKRFRDRRPSVSLCSQPEAVDFQILISNQVSRDVFCGRLLLLRYCTRTETAKKNLT